MATYKYDGTSWIGYNEYDTALEIVQKSKNNILYLESLHNTGMIEEELQQIRNQLNEVRTEFASLEIRTEAVEETLPLKQDELSAGLAIGIYGTTIAVKLQDIAAKLDSVPTGAAITTSSADLIRVENKLYYKTETSVGGMTTYAYEELTNSELTERIVAQIPTDFKIDENGRLILVHDGNVIGAGVEIGGIGVTIDAPATATQGTLTATQIGVLEASETNYIMFNHEKYYLMDKQHTSGSLTYSHVGADNQINHIKTFTITLSNMTWVLIDTEVGKSEPAITAVDSLPTPTEEEFEKHKIYLNGAVLKYIVKISSNDINFSQPTTLDSNYKYKIAAAVVNNYLYIFGGSTNDSQSNFASDNTKDVIKINLSTYQKTTISGVLPVAASGISAIPVGDYIYLLGVGSNAVYKYDTRSDTILNTNISTSAKAGMSAIRYNQFIYIFGGTTLTSSSNSNISTIQKINTQEDTIATLSATLPSKRCCSGIAIIDNNIYVVAGYNNSSKTASNTIYVFDVISETITTSEQALPFSTIFTMCFTDGNNLYITYNPYIYKYNLSDNTISIVATFLNSSNSLMGAVASDQNNIYFCGGIGNLFQVLQFGFEYLYKSISTE